MKKLVVSVLCACCVGQALAKTVAWYHFDEGNVGSSATTDMSILNAVDNTTLIGTPGRRGTGADDTYLPTFVDEFATYTYLVDPVAHTTNANHRALAFKRGNNSSGEGRLGGFVEVASDATLSAPALTVEFFVRPGTKSGGMQWVAKRNGSGGGNFTYSICQTSGKPYVNIYSLTNGVSMGLDPNTGASKFVSNTALTPGVWHHIALTVDPSADASHPTAKLYVDYELKSTVTLVNPLLYVDSGTKGPLYLGASSMGYYTPSGTLDEVRISDTVLTSDQFLRWENVHTSDAAIRLSFDHAYDRTVISNALYSAAGQTIENEVRDASYEIKTLMNSNSPLPVWQGEDLPFEAFYRGYLSTEPAVPNGGAVNFSVTEGKTEGFAFYVAENHEIMSDDFTLECSFKMPTKLSESSYFINQNWRANGADAVSRAFVAYVTSAGNLTMAGTPVGGSYVSSSSVGVVTDGQWHHVGVVYDKSEKIVSLYLDRTNVVSLSNFEIGTEDTENMSLYLLGSSSKNRFNAVIDEYVITRRALTPAEFVTPTHGTATRLYVDFEGSAKLQPAVLHMGEGSATVTATYADRVPGAYVLDASDATQRANTKSLAFDGTAMSVKFPHVAAIELASMTAEFFMRYEAADGYAGLLRFCQANDNYWTTPIWNIGFDSDASEIIMRVDTAVKGNQGHVFGNSFLDGRWHHLAVTFEPYETTNTLVRMYDTTYRQDPKQVGGDWVVQGKLRYDNGSCLGVGTSSMSRYFTGNIDELRISEGVLEPSQFMKWEKESHGMGLFFR